MKKILFATTALIATASVAAAEVNIGGSARFGLNYQSTDSVAPTGTPAAITAAQAAATASAAAAAAAQAVVTANTATGTLTAAQALAALNTAGVAAADAAALDAIDGTAGDSSTNLESRVTINLDFATETDGGLELGGRIRIRADEAAAAAMSGANIFVKSGGFKLTVGNFDGPIEAMGGYAIYNGSVGLNGNGYHNLVTNTRGAGYWGWDAFSSTGAGVNGAMIEYTAGDFKAALSYQDVRPAASHRVALSLAYTFGDWTAALGVQEGDQVGGVDDKVVLTLAGTLGDFGVGFAIADNNGTQKIALNGSYTMGATTISGYVADEDTAGIDSSYGLNVAYDLGGATLVGGVSSGGDAFGGSTVNASAGIKFSF